MGRLVKMFALIWRVDVGRWMRTLMLVCRVEGGSGACGVDQSPHTHWESLGCSGR
jgi:hypothetical protein